MTEQAMKSTLSALIAQRESLEMEANAIGLELKSPGLNGEPPAGIKDPLVDSEGFPRGDIDLYRVRAQRKRLAEINTDYKTLMKRLEESMLALYQSFPSDNRLTATGPKVEDKAPGESTTAFVAESTVTPFAQLDEILAGSPAYAAGIMEGDLLLAFGHIVSTTPDRLKAIAQLVGENVNKEIVLKVRREGELVVEVTITPTTWGGRGLLGCHLTPI